MVDADQLSIPAQVLSVGVCLVLGVILFAIFVSVLKAPSKQSPTPTERPPYGRALHRPRTEEKTVLYGSVIVRTRFGESGMYVDMHRDHDPKVYAEARIRTERNSASYNVHFGAEGPKDISVSLVRNDDGDVHYFEAEGIPYSAGRDDLVFNDCLSWCEGQYPPPARTIYHWKSSAHLSSSRTTYRG